MTKKDNKLGINEKEVKLLEFDMDLSNEEADLLAECGLKLIKDDKNELINYAINAIFKDLIEDTEKQNKFFEGLIEKDKLLKKRSEKYGSEENRRNKC